MIDDVESRTIKACREVRFRHRHAYTIPKPLTQRTGSGLDTRRETALRMSRGAAAPLTKSFYLCQRKRIAGQMQQSIQQHRTMSRREDKAIAVHPLRICRVMF